MAGTLGEYSVGKGAGSYQLLAVPATARWRTAGGTIDWSTVTAVGGKNAAGTITVTAVEGNITFTYGANTTGNVAYNADAATIEAALEGLASIGNGNIRVAGTSPNFTYELIADLAKTPRHSTFTSTGAAIAETQAGSADADVTIKDGTVVKSGDKYLEGGNVWKARIRAGGPGQPTLSDVLAALPMLTWTEGN